LKAYEDTTIAENLEAELTQGAIDCKTACWAMMRPIKFG